MFKPRVNSDRKKSMNFANQLFKNKIDVNSMI